MNGTPSGPLEQVAVLKNHSVRAEWEAAADKLQTTTDMYGRIDRAMGLLLTTKTIVVAFVPVFMSVFTTVVLGFGLIYLGSWKLNPKLFGDAAVQPNYVDALFFSITTITTSGISELRPHTSIAKMIVSGELLTGVTLVSLLVLLFSTLHLSDVAKSQQTWSEAQEAFAKEFRIVGALLDFLTAVGPEVKKTEHKDS